MNTLNYGSLLKRQAFLQAEQRRLQPGLPAMTPDSLRMAVFTEVGEMCQELKPEWAWWKKLSDRRELDRERLADEAADVLHFALIGDLSRDHRYAVDVIATWPLTCPDAQLVGLILASSDGHTTACLLATLLSRYGITPEQLVAAYWAKTEVNLDRWRNAQ